jgi:hypothetical protein
MPPHRPDHDETLEALADRLRRLPPPPVPAGLAARLLTSIPPAVRPQARRAPARIAAAVLLAAAAALLLAVRVPRPVPPPVPSVRRPADDAPTLWRFEQALRRSDADASVALGRAMPSFEWPVTGPAPHSGRFTEPLQ